MRLTTKSGQKWFIVAIYKLPKVGNTYFIDFMSHLYDLIMSESKDIICLGDFNINMLVSNPVSDEICNVYNVYNVIEGPTCFKSSRGTHNEQASYSHVVQYKVWL